MNAGSNEPMTEYLPDLGQSFAPPVAPIVHPDVEDLISEAEELRYLLRQVLFARQRVGPGPLADGPRLADDLAGWGLTDLDGRLWAAVNVEAP